MILAFALMLGLVPAALGPVTAKADTSRYIVKKLYENSFETNPFNGSCSA